MAKDVIGVGRELRAAIAGGEIVGQLPPSRGRGGFVTQLVDDDVAVCRVGREHRLEYSPRYCHQIGWLGRPKR